MKGRIIAVAVVALLAFCGSASAASFAPRVLCGASCGTLAASNGDGTLRMTATGTTYGNIGSGRIAIKDIDGGHDFQVTGSVLRTWKDNGFTYFSGRNLFYFVTSRWAIKIHGTSGITSSTTASGHGFIQGSGRWSRNGHTSVSWPSGGASFALSATS
jgi:hypothetical protein